MKIRAAVLNRMGAPMPYAESKPLSITEVDLDPPGPGEVLVKIAAAGLCHSDRYQRTAHRITSAVNCRPLNSLPCRMTPAPLSALSRRHVYPIRTRLTNLQQIPSHSPFDPSAVASMAIDRSGSPLFLIKAACGLHWTRPML